jgi:hypothetical protein
MHFILSAQTRTCLLVINPLIVLSAFPALGQYHYRHTRCICLSYRTRHARFLHIRNNGAVPVVCAPRTCKHLVVADAERFNNKHVSDLLVGRRRRESKRLRG